MSGEIMLVPGAKVRLRRDVYRHMVCNVAAGRTGVVVEATPGMVTVRLDKSVIGLGHWDNVLCWNNEHLVDVAGDLEVVTNRCDDCGGEDLPREDGICIECRKEVCDSALADPRWEEEWGHIEEERDRLRARMRERGLVYTNEAPEG